MSPGLYIRASKVSLLPRNRVLLYLGTEVVSQHRFIVISNMPVYHIVLFKTKSSAPQEVLDEFARRAKAMVTQVPGLLKVDVNSPLLATKHRAQGYDMGLVAILEKAEDLTVYATHPAHLHAHELREQICEDALAYDLEFPG
ncbi:hypothetical protein GGS26DRAFT_551406 [Hypomontagnella submonticulosa]|nr:hypothetical protein GGS26DRAFT_551406 [Hypomontagnella submonticulosa]